MVVPSDVYYGGPSGTTSQPVEGLTDAKRRTVDFRRDIQPIIDAKCANCHNASNPPNRQWWYRVGECRRCGGIQPFIQQFAGATEG